jgi:hypothetical protein
MASTTMTGDRMLTIFLSHGMLGLHQVTKGRLDVQPAGCLSRRLALAGTHMLRLQSDTPVRSVNIFLIKVNDLCHKPRFSYIASPHLRLFDRVEHEGNGSQAPRGHTSPISEVISTTTVASQPGDNEDHDSMRRTPVRDRNFQRI